MNTRGVKLLLFGLIITLFSLMLVFAGFVFWLLDATPYLVNGYPGRGAYIIVLLAIVAGIGGLYVAWFGLNRND